MQIVKEKSLKPTKIQSSLQLFACQMHNNNNMFETKVKNWIWNFSKNNLNPFEPPRASSSLQKSSSELWDFRLEQARASARSHL